MASCEPCLMNNGLLEGVAFKQIHIQCVPGGVWLELGWIRTIRYLKRILWLLLWGCTNHILWISLRGCRKNILSCIPFLMFQLGSRKILHSLLSNLIAVYCLVRPPWGYIIEKPYYNVDIVFLRFSTWSDLHACPVIPDTLVISWDRHLWEYIWLFLLRMSW